MSCPTEAAFNATFSSVLIGSSSGACQSGFAGTITRTCLYNATTGQAYWGAPTGSCKRMQSGRMERERLRLVSTDMPSAPGATRVGGCRCAAVTCSGGEYDNAEWPPFAPMGEDTYVTATACKAGYRATDPDQPTQRLCSASGTYSATIVNPCIRTSRGVPSRTPPAAAAH